MISGPPPKFHGARDILVRSAWMWLVSSCFLLWSQLVRHGGAADLDGASELLRDRPMPMLHCAGIDAGRPESRPGLVLKSMTSRPGRPDDGTPRWALTQRCDLLAGR